jgi:hypothetical protein
MCNACFRIVRSWGTKSRLYSKLLVVLTAPGRVTLYEDDNDLILKISKPYLQFSIMD